MRPARRWWHPTIAKIAFTGSTEVGRHPHGDRRHGKKLTLELGGKSPFIVFDDADLDAAVEGVVDAIWFNQGEVCCAGSRLLVQEGVAEKLYAKVRARMETLRVGRAARQVDRYRRRRLDRSSWSASPRLVEKGEARGRRSLPQPSTLRFRAPATFFAPTLMDRRRAGLDRCRCRDFRAGARRHDLPHA